MSIVVKDTSVDKSNLIKFRSLNVKRELYSKPDSCFFTYGKYGSRTYVPAGGNEIGVWDGATKIFGGKIISVKKRIEGSILSYDVDCKDWVDTLDKKLVTETYESMTVNAIIADMKANYATTFDILNVACATVIEKIDFAAMPVSKCLDRLAEITGYHWYVDPDKKIYFFVEGGQSSPFDITDTNGNYNTQSLDIDEDYAQIKNKINIQGGSISNVQVSDATSIATYGEHEVIIRDDTLTTTAEATQKANAVLADYKDPIFKGSFITLTAGLEPGQEINVNSTIGNISKDFIIQSVDFIARTPSDFEYRVKIMTQRDKGLMEFLQNQAMKPLPTPALGNTQFSTNIKFSITNYHEISWTAGTIIMSDDKEYSIASGSHAFSGTNIIYFKPTTSETVLQFSATLANGMGSDRLAIGYCVENSNVSKGAQMIPVGYHGGIQAWGGENIVARTIVADQIGLNSLVSNLVTTGEFITLTAQVKNAIITDAKIVSLTATKIITGTLEVSSSKVGILVKEGGDILIEGDNTNPGRIEWRDPDNTTHNWEMFMDVGISADFFYLLPNNLTHRDIWIGKYNAGGADNTEKSKQLVRNFFVKAGNALTEGSAACVNLQAWNGANSGSGHWSLLQVGGNDDDAEVKIGGRLVPSDTDTYDLGISTKKWNKLYIKEFYPTSVNTNLIPSGTYGLGSTTKRWGELYLSGNGVGHVHFYGSSTDWATMRGDKDYIKFQSSATGVGDFALLPEQNDKMNIGSTTEYWRYVYARYIRYKSNHSSFDKYDDLQILRDLKTSGGKIEMKSMPKEVYDKKGFTDMGGLQDFNLCASKKIVECVDDLKKTIDDLTNRLKMLERKII